jgi:hypothetical protein
MSSFLSSPTAFPFVLRGEGKPKNSAVSVVMMSVYTHLLQTAPPRTSTDVSCGLRWALLICRVGPFRRSPNSAFTVGLLRIFITYLCKIHFIHSPYLSATQPNPKWSCCKIFLT